MTFPPLKVLKATFNIAVHTGEDRNGTRTLNVSEVHNHKPRPNMPVITAVYQDGQVFIFHNDEFAVAVPSGNIQSVEFAPGQKIPADLAALFAKRAESPNQIPLPLSVPVPAPSPTPSPTPAPTPVPVPLPFQKKGR
jgi:hypothetical protein